MNGEKGKKTGEEKRKRKRREREKEQGRKRERENDESDRNDDFKSRSVNMNAKTIDKNASGDAASRHSRLRIKACEKGCEWTRHVKKERDWTNNTGIRNDRGGTRFKEYKV